MAYYTGPTEVAFARSHRALKSLEMIKICLRLLYALSALHVYKLTGHTFVLQAQKTLTGRTQGPLRPPA